MVISGVATAVIIGATTLNYTFVGISILFALLLMRGGVLILAPVVDTLFGRKVRASSWVALGLCLVAVAIAFAEVGGYQMTLVAGLNIAAYLLGYCVRIPNMTYVAKSTDPAHNIRYFHEETLVAALALTGVPALWGLIGRGQHPGRAARGVHQLHGRPAGRPLAHDRGALRLPLPVRDRDLPELSREHLLHPAESLFQPTVGHRRVVRACRRSSAGNRRAAISLPGPASSSPPSSSS